MVEKDKAFKKILGLLPQWMSSVITKVLEPTQSRVPKGSVTRPFYINDLEVGIRSQI